MRTPLARTILAAALLAAPVALGPALAQQAQPNPPPKRVVPNDPSIYRPPPMPPERPYVAPSPGPAAPMERIPAVPPPAQPPTR